MTKKIDLDEVARNYVENLGDDELLIFIIALIEEKDDPEFTDSVILELLDISGDDLLFEDIDHSYLPKWYEGDVESSDESEYD